MCHLRGLPNQLRIGCSGDTSTHTGKRRTSCQQVRQLNSTKGTFTETGRRQNARESITSTQAACSEKATKNTWATQSTHSTLPIETSHDLITAYCNNYFLIILMF